jgi:hypothetical protein
MARIRKAQQDPPADQRPPESCSLSVDCLGRSTALPDEPQSAGSWPVHGRRRKPSVKTLRRPKRVCLPTRSGSLGSWQLLPSIHYQGVFDRFCKPGLLLDDSTIEASWERICFPQQPDWFHRRLRLTIFFYTWLVHTHPRQRCFLGGFGGSGRYGPGVPWDLPWRDLTQFLPGCTCIDLDWNRPCLPQRSNFDARLASSDSNPRLTRSKDEYENRSQQWKGSLSNPTPWQS